MEPLGLILAVVMGIDIFSIWWSHRKLKTAISGISSNAPITDSNKAFVEHVIYTRTGLNTIYTAITIITAFLVFLGLNVKKDLIDEAKKLIEEESKVDIQKLQETRLIWEKYRDTEFPKVDSIIQTAKLIDAEAGEIKSDIEIKSADLHRLFTNARSSTENSQRAYGRVVRNVADFVNRDKALIDYRVYVVRNIIIEPGKSQYHFSEFVGLPAQFADTPSVIFEPAVELLDQGKLSGPLSVQVTPLGIGIVVNTPIRGDLWVFGKRSFQNGR